MRSARTENPGRLVLVDTDGTAASAAALPAALDGTAFELSVRDGAVTTPRVIPWPPTGHSSRRPGTEAWRLGVERKGTLDGLRLVPCPEVTGPLGPREVRISMRAAGVNFRDVLTALGMYPGDATAIGLEGAGVITETGAEVTSVAPATA